MFCKLKPNLGIFLPSKRHNRRLSNVLSLFSHILLMICFNDTLAAETKHTHPANFGYFDDLFNQGGKNPIHENNLHQLPPSLLENHPRYRPVFIDVLHYDINVAVNPYTSELQGKVGIRFSSKISELKKVSFDADSLKILKVQTSDQKPLNFQIKKNLIEIQLTRPLSRGDIETIVIEYQSQNPQSIALSGPDMTNPHRGISAYSYTQPEDTSTWLPCIDRPDDKATASIAVQFPEGFNALSNGILISQTKTSASYEMNDPIAPYLISLAIGPFEKAQLGSFRDKPLTIWSPAALMPLALSETQKTPLMMEIFSEFTGVEYPFTHYAQSVAESIGASMEHQTATTMGGSRITGDGSGESVVAHELAHQWFGDWVTCQSWGELWLNEGFASYLPFVFYEKISNQLRSLSQLDSWRKNYFREAQEFPRALSESNPNVGKIFDSHSYDKGALIIHMMRGIVDQLDNKGMSHGFTSVLRQYLSSRAKSNATYHDLMNALETVTGISWRVFFDQWVLSPGHPKLTVTHRLHSDIHSQSTPPRQRELILSVEQIQIGEKWRSFTFPIDVELIFSDGSTEIHQFTIYDTITDITIPLSKDLPVSFNINPTWSIPIEYKTDQNVAGWKTILSYSEFPTSRLSALRELNNLNVFDNTSLGTEGVAVLAQIMKDPQPYIKIQALQLLLQKIDGLQPIERASEGSFELIDAIRQLANNLKRDDDGGYQIKAALLRTEERLIQLEKTGSFSESAWQEKYHSVKTVAERDAILGILSHLSEENSVHFMNDRLQEGHWSTQDRLNIVMRLVRKPNPYSLKILGDILRSTPSSMFIRPILDQALKEKWTYSSLLAPALTMLQQHSKDNERSVVLQWLAIQKSDQGIICPVLLNMKRQPETYRASRILLDLEKTIQNLECPTL